MENLSKSNKYWFDDLPKEYNWHSLWYDYTICFNCEAIRKQKGLCPVCKRGLPEEENKINDGKNMEVFSYTSTGAEGRFEDYVYLDMLENEWLRPINNFQQFKGISDENRPGLKAIMVLVFWTYFETKIERLLMSAMKDVPESIRLDLLKRYQSITSRTSELYKVLFGKSNTYFKDLETLGYEDVSSILKEIQKSRNKFMHGNPEAIDNQLIDKLVKMLKREHESWIAVYNMKKMELLNNKAVVNKK